MLFSAEKLFEKNERQAFFSRVGRRVFLDDWEMKLIALVITLALWLGVSGFREPITTRLSGVTLQLRVSNEYEITNPLVNEVALVISGDRRKIEPIRADNLIVSIDLTDVGDGEQVLQLTPETVNVELPTGVKLEEVQPNKIPVKLEKVIEREIPVQVETEGNLPENYEFYGSPVVSPARVRVRGPESTVRALDSISTERIDIVGRQNDFTAQQVSLNVVNPKVTVLDSVVDVGFRVGEKKVERGFLIPVRTDSGERRVHLVLYGPISLLANLSPEQIDVEIVRSEAGETTPEVRLPDEFKGSIEIRKRKINP